MILLSKAAIIGIGATASAILAGAGFLIFKPTEEIKQRPKDTLKGALEISGDVPDDFFLTIAPPPPPPAPEPVKPEPEPLPEPEPTILPPPEMFFNFVKKEEPPKPDPVEIKRRMVLQKSLYSLPGSKEVVTLKRNRKSIYDQGYRSPTESKQQNFSEHGVPSKKATYPVDLTRVLTADKYIPATLYTEIESEVPSQKVIAVVSQDVTGFHGKKILIPKGSRAIGIYDKIGSPDASRMAIGWQRILTPDGINIKLTSESADQEGASGLAGFVDQKWRDKYGTALLFSSISALTQLSVPVNNENAKAAADAFTGEVAPVVAEQLRQSLDILPRINIPQGYIFNISPLVDIWFKEPKGKTIEAVEYTGNLLQ